MKFTVFGASGFIGRNLVEHLQMKGHSILAPTREELDDLPRELGNVIYAIGLTGDFRTRPYDTVDAHVCLLSRLLKCANFDSWLYLSSTRLYSRLPVDAVASEAAYLTMDSSPDNLYDLTKLVGESLCLTYPSPNVRVARLSNVYGVGQSRSTFLASVLHEMTRGQPVVLGETPDSSKDYVSVSDVNMLLERIALGGAQRIYNVASGRQTQHAMVMEVLRQKTVAEIQYAPSATRRVFPRIDVSAIEAEFAISPRMVLDDLPTLFDAYRANYLHTGETN